MEPTDNSVIVRNNQAVESTRDMWEDFKNKKSRNGTFVAFDDYRQSLGGRGIWGTKIFFRAMVEIRFLTLCDENTNSKGKYCPTQYAIEKYGDLFQYDADAEIWGLCGEHLEDFDLMILPHIMTVARKLDVIYKEEKKEMNRIRYEAKKRQARVNQPIEMEDGI
jgi:hypothetical protein